MFDFLLAINQLPEGQLNTHKHDFYCFYFHLHFLPYKATPWSKMAAQKVWLVTGTSSGFGNELAHTILKNGHKVVAAGRSTSRLASLKEAGAAVTKIDQNEPLDVLKKQVEDAIAVYGHIDVIVLNAAYVVTGTLEERRHASIPS